MRHVEAREKRAALKRRDRLAGKFKQRKALADQASTQAEYRRLEKKYGVMAWEHWASKRRGYASGEVRYQFLRDADTDLYFDTLPDVEREHGRRARGEGTPSSAMHPAVWCPRSTSRSASSTARRRRRASQAASKSSRSPSRRPPPSGGRAPRGGACI